MSTSHKENAYFIDKMYSEEKGFLCKINPTLEILQNALVESLKFLCFALESRIIVCVFLQEEFVLLGNGRRMEYS